MNYKNNYGRFSFDPFTNETLKQAINDFFENPEEAIRKYNKLEYWDTSKVTDMSNHLVLNQRTIYQIPFIWNFILGYI